MARRTFSAIIAGGALLTVLGVVWWGSQHWRARPRAIADGPAANVSSAATSTDKIIVSEHAQKNLALTAKPLRAEVYWKTITVPGMIVDRPGLSDREIVAPVVGTVSRLFHVPGDTVRPGDPLFKLRLASESIHETQADLFKTSQELELAEAKKERLALGGEGIPGVRLIEADNEISRLKAAIKSYREELSHRAFSSDEIDGVTQGELVSEITVVTPQPAAGQGLAGETPVSTFGEPTASAQPFAYEVQSLKVELGEQVDAGRTLCHLSSHRLLAIEGRAFRDETSLLEQSIEQHWPVEVDFGEDAGGDWPAMQAEFHIHYIANTIDPATRTFGFLIPLDNQYKEVRHGETTQLLWRFRPGQKVRLRVRVERLENVFVLPAEAVVFEGADAFVFTQNVNTFERKSVHVLFHDRDQAVLADDGSLQAYTKDGERRTVPAIARTAAAQLNRMTKAGGGGVPAGYHIHADGSLHKNEDEGK
jgi:cobalt-zinc-cadmium efflux system membrane fusion protein